MTFYEAAVQVLEWPPHDQEELAHEIERQGLSTADGQTPRATPWSWGVVGGQQWGEQAVVDLGVEEGHAYALGVRI